MRIITWLISAAIVLSVVWATAFVFAILAGSTVNLFGHIDVFNNALVFAGYLTGASFILACFGALIEVESE